MQIFIYTYLMMTDNKLFASSVCGLNEYTNH